MRQLFTITVMVLVCAGCKHSKTNQTANKPTEAAPAPTGSTSTPQIALSSRHGCAARGRALRCWEHTPKELEKHDSYSSPPYTSKPFTLTTSLTHLAADDNAFYALLDSNRVIYWKGADADRREELFADASAVATFEGRVCAIVEEKRVECVTFDDKGLPIPDVELNRTFDSSIAELAIGSEHACVIFEDRTSSCWKVSGSTVLTAPEEGAAEQLRDVKAMALGEDYTCMILGETDLLCWGGFFTHGEVKRKAFRAEAFDILSRPGKWCAVTTQPPNLLCQETVATEWSKPRPLMGGSPESAYLPEMLENRSNKNLSTILSSSHFALRGKHACVIEAGEEIVCYNPAAPYMTTRAGKEPARVEGLSNVASVTIIGSTTIARTSDQKLWWMGGVGNSRPIEGINVPIVTTPIPLAAMLPPKSTPASGERSREELSATQVINSGDKRLLLQTPERGWLSFEGNRTRPALILDPEQKKQIPLDVHVLGHPNSYWVCTSNGKADAEVLCHEDFRHGAFKSAFEGIPVELRPNGLLGLCLRSDSGSWFCKTKPDSPFVEQKTGSAIAATTTSVNVTCSLRENGKLTCEASTWVQNDEGKEEKRTYTLEDNDIEHITSSKGVTCKLDKQHTLSCLGHNKTGQISPVKSDDVIDFYTEFTTIEGLPPVRSVEVGKRHACAISDAGELWCWGNNKHGETGAPTLYERRVK